MAGGPVSTSSVAELVAALQEADPRAALEELSSVVANAFGHVGALVGDQMRQSGGVARLVLLLYTRGEPDMQATLLSLIGNLCSSAVDASAATTKHALLELGCGGTLVDRIRYPIRDEHLTSLTCGTLQNLCSDAQWCQFLIDNGALADLERLLEHPNPALARYAAGCLSNLQSSLAGAGQPPPLLSALSMQTIGHRREQAVLNAFRERRAARIIARGVEFIPPERRLQRILLAGQRGSHKPPGVPASGGGSQRQLVGKGAPSIGTQRQLPHRPVPPPPTCVQLSQGQSCAADVSSRSSAQTAQAMPPTLPAMQTAQAMPPTLPAAQNSGQRAPVPAQQESAPRTTGAMPYGRRTALDDDSHDLQGGGALDGSNEGSSSEDDDEEDAEHLGQLVRKVEGWRRRRSWREWAASTRARLRALDLLELGGEALVQRCSRKAWRTWSERAQQAVWAGATVQRALRKLSNVERAAAWRRWAHTTRLLRSAAGQNEHADAFFLAHCWQVLCRALAAAAAAEAAVAKHGEMARRLHRRLAWSSFKTALERRPGRFDDPSIDHCRALYMYVRTGWAKVVAWMHEAQERDALLSRGWQQFSARHLAPAAAAFKAQVATHALARAQWRDMRRLAGAHLLGCTWSSFVRAARSDVLLFRATCVLVQQDVAAAVQQWRFAAELRARAR